MIVSIERIQGVSVLCVKLTDSDPFFFFFLSFGQIQQRRGGVITDCVVGQGTMASLG